MEINFPRSKDNFLGDCAHKRAPFSPGIINTTLTYRHVDNVVPMSASPMFSICHPSTHHQRKSPSWPPPPQTMHNVQCIVRAGDDYTLLIPAWPRGFIVDKVRTCREKRLGRLERGEAPTQIQEAEALFVDARRLFPAQAARSLCEKRAELSLPPLFIQRNQWGAKHFFAQLCANVYLGRKQESFCGGEWRGNWVEGGSVANSASLRRFTLALPGIRSAQFHEENFHESFDQ